MSQTTQLKENSGGFQELRETVHRLRSPGGCPWDQEQTHESMRDPLIEECCEVLDAIDRKDWENLKEELGDLLLHVVFHSELAEESGHFNAEDVAKRVNQKLIDRHPHVFGEEHAESAEEVLEKWDAIKAKEKGEAVSKRVFKDLPSKLPALLYAYKTWKRIEKHGLKKQYWEIPVDAEEDELVIGAKLFEVVTEARAIGVDPESALRRYTSMLREDLEPKED